MWWISIPILVLLLAIIGLAGFFFPGISNYAARYYCGAIFGSRREPEDIKHDLFFVPISWASCTVDREKKEVTASVWGFAKRKARYVEGHGIKLLVEGADIPRPVAQRVRVRKPKPWPIAVNESVNEWLLPYTKREVGKTLAVVVLHRGELVGEVYADGIDASTPLHSWSLTKSLMNALTGILVAKGDLALDQKPDIPGWSDDGRRDLTVQNLLQMDSGFNWKETEKDFLKVSRMLFLEQDVVTHSQAVPLAYTPGENWAYASCNTNVLSGMIRDLFPTEAAYHAFPRKALFMPLGMAQTAIHTDVAGNLVGSSFSMGTARDWAKFGQLYLNEGRVGETQLLPKDWVEFSRQSSPAAAGEYGAHFWLNASGTYPDLPRDLYFAAGFLGQRIAIFPSHELVIVRMGLSFRSQCDLNVMFRGVMDRLGIQV